MIKILLSSLLLFSACSFKTPQNEWQYKSANSFNSYVKNFLYMNDSLAKDDLKRAIKHAKNSADLTQLAKIYLGESGLEISTGNKNISNKYTEISNLVDSKSLDAYYSLLQLNIEKSDVEYLPKRYRSFAHYLIKKEFNRAQEAILEIEKPTSALLCGALIKEHLNKSTRTMMIKISSYNGYKRSVIFWLKERLKYTKNEKEREHLLKKISILYER